MWIWNLCLELGQHLAPATVHTTEFAPAHVVSPVPASDPAPAVVYGPAQWAIRSFTGGFPGSAFTWQPDGTLRCPTDHPLYAQERRPERDGSLRVLYDGRIGHCRECPLKEQCQEHPSAVSPFASVCSPALARLAMSSGAPTLAFSPSPRNGDLLLGGSLPNPDHESILTCEQRAHYRPS